MAKLQIIYDASVEIDQIIKIVEEFSDVKKDEKEVFDTVQKIVQAAFDEGRRFQKQISISSPYNKDGVIFKSEI